MNIILLISDTYRYDNLFDRASMPVRTPCLDAFSQRAVSLSRMYMSSFPTIPHRTDLTSGRYGWPWYPWQNRDDSSPNHMPLLLEAAGGHATQLLCDCPHLFNAGIDAGFNARYTLRGQEGDSFFMRKNRPMKAVMPHEKTRRDKGSTGPSLADRHRWMNPLWYREVDRFAPRTAEMAVEWLEENYQHHPLFLWVDFFDPHEPWDPPEYMVKRYDPDYDGTPMIHPNYGRADDLTPAELKNLARRNYCAEAEMVDRWVGRVLQKVDDLQMWDDSIVIFTTDHGISLGEHNRTGKSCINPGDDRLWPLYPELAHVPFLIAAPGLEGGRTVDVLLQTPDILPTLADMAGLKLEPEQPFHGVSFAPMLRGELTEPIHDIAITAAHLRVSEEELLTHKNTPVVYTEKWAYAPLGPKGERELFDLYADPDAETNIADKHPEVVAELHAKLIDWLRNLDSPPEAISPFE